MAESRDSGLLGPSVSPSMQGGSGLWMQKLPGVPPGPPGSSFPLGFRLHSQGKPVFVFVFVFFLEKSRAGEQQGSQRRHGGDGGQSWWRLQHDVGGEGSGDWHGSQVSALAEPRHLLPALYEHQWISGLGPTVHQHPYKGRLPALPEPPGDLHHWGSWLGKRDSPSANPIRTGCAYACPCQGPEALALVGAGKGWA